MKSVAFTHGDRVWPVGMETFRRDLRTFKRGRETFGRTVHSPARFLVKLRREFNVESYPPGSVARLRVPAPYEDRTQRDIQVEVVEQPQGSVVTRAPGRIEALAPVPRNCGVLAVEMHVRLTASCETITVDPRRLEDFDRADPEVSLYTRPFEGLIQVTAPIARLAESIAGKSTNAWGALQAFWRFFFEKLKLGNIHPDELSPVDPLAGLLAGSWVDCFAGNSLLVALCRARGIPARLVGGVFLDPEGPNSHYWSEVLLPPYGWFPIDLMSWELACGDFGQTEWSHHFFGHMDYRMKTECLPRTFVGQFGAPRPAAWYILMTRDGDTTEVAHYGLPQVLLYRDRLQVIDLPCT
jgi:transglutaminase-like putative cysteine protease